jgi:6-phosphogluconate dehydrogenase
MKLAIIGLGRMGRNMTERLLKEGHEVVAYARDAASVAEAEELGAIGAHSVEEVVRKLDPPRVVWLMIPVGKPVEETIKALWPLLSRGDIIADGGNSRFTDSVRRASELAADGIGFLDSGTSGGVWGLEESRTGPLVQAKDQLTTPMVSHFTARRRSAWTFAAPALR